MPERTWEYHHKKEMVVVNSTGCSWCDSPVESLTRMLATYPLSLLLHLAPLLSSGSSSVSLLTWSGRLSTARLWIQVTS